MQHVPQASEQDLKRIAQRDYPQQEADEILRLISSVEVPEKNRVVLACLKNANGNVDRLKSELESASGYWREIISTAEYPLATKRWSELQKLPQDEQQKIYDHDWQQYQDWLNRS